MTERITVSLSDSKVIVYLEKLRNSHKNISKAIENIMIEALKDEDQKEYEYIEKIVISFTKNSYLIFNNVSFCRKKALQISSIKQYILYYSYYLILQNLILLNSFW